MESKELIVKRKPWSKMSKVEKRKALAEDVIFNVKKKIIEAYGGTYCDIYPKKNEDTKAYIEETGMCQVCAMGSLMTTDILNRNSYKGDWDDDQIIERFKGIFSEFQLRLIETAFEKEVINDVEDYLRDEEMDNTVIAEKAIKFGSKYTDDNKRLLAIMKNIIKDPKGLFLGVDYK